MNLIILILVWIYIVYNINGLLEIIHLLICIINIFITTILISFNPDSLVLTLIRLLSCIILVIIIFNSIIKLFTIFIL
jgi:hypothetical protein